MIEARVVEFNIPPSLAPGKPYRRRRHFYPFTGNDKVAIQGYDSVTQTPYVAKIYKQTNTSNGSDNEQRARIEFANYQLLRKTELRPYIPKPLFLLAQNRKIVGLAVESRPNHQLPFLLRQRVFTKKELDQFERAVRSLKSRGIMLDDDTINGANVCYDPTRIPHIFLAECNVRYGSADEVQHYYNTYMTNGFLNLRINYQI